MSMFFGGESFQEFVRKRAKPARFSNFLEFRNDYVLNFRKIISQRFSEIRRWKKMIFEKRWKLEKKIRSSSELEKKHRPQPGPPHSDFGPNRRCSILRFAVPRFRPLLHLTTKEGTRSREKRVFFSDKLRFSKGRKFKVQPCVNSLHGNEKHGASTPAFQR